MRQERPVSSVTVAAPCGHPIGVCLRRSDGLFSACELSVNSEHGEFRVNYGATMISRSR